MTDEARLWLRAHAENPQDVPARTSSVGLDREGLVLIATIQELIDQRAAALTDAALDEQPAWLERLGPEPRDQAARTAWLAEITATVARLDQQLPRPLVGPSPAPAPAASAAAPQGASIS